MAGAIMTTDYTITPGQFDWEDPLNWSGMALTYWENLTASAKLMFNSDPTISIDLINTDDSAEPVIRVKMITDDVNPSSPPDTSMANLVAWNTDLMLLWPALTPFTLSGNPGDVIRSNTHMEFWGDDVPSGP